eukprot:7386429-Prymnesium_polylepis.1
MRKNQDFKDEATGDVHQYVAKANEVGDQVAHPVRSAMRSLAVVAALPAALAFGFSPSLTSPQRTASRSGVQSVQAIANLLQPPATSGRDDIGDVLPDCPNTIWNENDIDVDEWQAKYRAEDDVTCPIEIVASAEDNAEGTAYFERRREEFSEILAKHGTIWFRGFDLMKDPDGFRDFWETLQLDPCLDPIHSSGLRKFLSKRDAVYEEVNKQACTRAGRARGTAVPIVHPLWAASDSHYIGLHNEATHKKTATTGAFVCFKPATVSGGEEPHAAAIAPLRCSARASRAGTLPTSARNTYAGSRSVCTGEFMIADGEKIFRDMPADILRTLLDREVRGAARCDDAALDPVLAPCSHPALSRVAGAHLGVQPRPRRARRGAGRLQGAADGEGAWPRR